MLNESDQASPPGPTPPQESIASPRRNVMRPAVSARDQGDRQVEDDCDRRDRHEDDPPPLRIIRAKPPRPPRTRAWLILPIGIAGVIVAVVLGMFLRAEEPQTVSDVTRQVREIVLRTSDRPGVEDGGPLGPLWIAAREADIMTGTFTDVRIRAGQVRLAAREAALIVDPKANTISFALDRVVLVRVPEYANETRVEPSLVNLDSYVIGPVPYKRRIVADGHPAGKRSAPAEYAGAQ